jgi:PQQ-dependent dehydrogenase (s-GDH family)
LLAKALIVLYFTGIILRIKPISMQKSLFKGLFLLSFSFCFWQNLIAQGEPFTSRIVTTGLSFPWEITWGPDNFIWVTERTGKRVTRVNPATGAKITAITISEVYQSVGQDGLMGMALHPNLLLGTGEDYVYVAYTYDADPTAGINRRAKIRRYTYTAATQTLASPLDLITNMPASDDHNSGRLKIGPDNLLYYTIGDQGANQFGNKCNAIRAQNLPTAAELSASDWTNYQGKVLRLNLDGSIPVSNPVLASVRSHVFTYGHRNAQGLAFAPDGKLYSSEHGPKLDDELNILTAGGNYGWPRVAGLRDNINYLYYNFSTRGDCSAGWDDDNPQNYVSGQTEASFTAPDYTAPLFCMYTQTAPLGTDWLTWPTVAPSSIEVYSSGQIIGWRNSLLVPTLKRGTVYRYKLNAAGTAVVGDSIPYFKGQGRYRDLCLNPAQTNIYLACDNTGTTSNPAGAFIGTPPNPGAIIEFGYSGVLALNPTTPGYPSLKRYHINVFPNPASQVLQVTNEKSQRKPIRYELLDLSGRIVTQNQSNKDNFSIDLSTLPRSVYFLKMYNGLGVFLGMEKIVVQ